MPTYEYVCDKCGHEFELFQKMTDPVKKRCPRCRSNLRRRIGTGAGILFKGSGFYATDYRSPDYKARAASESSSGGSTEGGKSDSTPSKPKKKDA